MKLKVLIVNGPNLNALGTREPEVYGRATLAELEANLRREAFELGASVDCFQSNHEGALIDRIQTAATEGIGYMIVNPGGLTHTSVALRDALAGVAIPFIEVHITNVHRREAFRHHSYVSALAQGVIVGFGTSGYSMALRFACERIRETAEE